MQYYCRLKRINLQFCIPSVEGMVYCINHAHNIDLPTTIDDYDLRIIRPSRYKQHGTRSKIGSDFVKVCVQHVTITDLGIF